MTCCDAPGLLPLSKALDYLLSAVKATSKTHKLAIEDALDGILAQAITSPHNVPAFDNSAMDGYALCFASNTEQLESGSQFKVVGKSFAGSPYSGEVQAGECVRIMTGAAIPSSCDSVTMQENCGVDGEIISLLQSARLGDNIRRAGNDIEQGQVILNAGRRLSPTDIGLLASIGRSQVSLLRPLKVGLFSTGDELRLPQQTLDPSCIYDSNRFVIAAGLKRLNIEVLNLGIIPDDPDALRLAFSRCQQECDAIISSGGVSVGEADYTKTILDELGDIEFWKLAIKPGKPFAFGKLAGTPFFGLPGNPSSAAITFHQLAVPTLLKMSGEIRSPALVLKAKAPKDIRKRPGRTDFQRGILIQEEDGTLNIDSSMDQSSGMLSSMSRGNCYIRIEQERGNVKAGEEVEIIPFDRWIE